MDQNQNQSQRIESQQLINTLNQSINCTDAEAKENQVQLQQCCQLLSDKLEAHESHGKLSANYLYGQQLCELDALVFGHVASILSSQLACPMLSDTVRAYPRLIAHSRGIDQVYHQGKQLGGQE
ncbi:uncharacterized protein Dmoj_GI21548 [Drosophila mojavensis]|uniref:Metaxin glutathione S-transferase domain-containing protein n=1 Tax=Drosophila mojavensis TaxID=7230 RepID=B4L5C1_DROMO|nr:uncharacterized protein Dmoj_GI21548 [Drosophila mojavensis]